MKYFTPERYLALQDFSSEESMDTAEAAWDEQAERYDAYLDTIKPTLPENVRRLLEGYYLHDASVLSMARREDRFDITLQLDVPPQELLTISYALAGEPALDEKAFTLPGSRRPLWLYEELEAVGSGYRHSILFSNGWTLDIPFRDVSLTTGAAVFPVPVRQSQSA
jgi:hypothetical protein